MEYLLYLTERTRTVVSQAHSYQWLGSFGNRGNGHYRQELRRAVAAIGLYSKAHDLPEERVLLRLDGQYGTGAVLADLAGFCYVMRGKDYTVLDRTEVQSRLRLPPDQQFSRPAHELRNEMEGTLSRVLEAEARRVLDVSNLWRDRALGACWWLVCAAQVLL